MRQIVYYTDSKLEENLDKAVREQIIKAANGIPIISVSQKPLDFGTNICVGEKPRCYLSLYEQLLTGLEATEKDAIVFTCEHDVFYHPCHFEFKPEHNDRIYFNLNRYYWSKHVNYFVKAIGKRALSQGIGHRDIFIEHAKDQVKKRVDNAVSYCIGPFENFESEFPNVDIRHGGNFSNSDRFREGEQRFYHIPHWDTPRLFQEKIKYRSEDPDTEYHLHQIMNAKDGPNPVEVPKFYRNYLPGLFYSLGFKKGAEIGVKVGVFSRIICAGMKDVKMLCVDPYLPGPKVSWDQAETRFAIAKDRLRDFNAEIIKQTSLQAVENVPRWSLDFVYIDADHSFNNVMQDIIVWADRVRPGGIVSGHDYDNEDVKTAVDAYVKVHNHELFITDKGEEYPDANPSWFFAKRKEVR